MQLGFGLPMTEVGPDLAGLVELVRGAEELGYSHVRVVDHVLGADPKFHVGKTEYFAYTHKSYLHEPFAFMGYLAALTREIQLVTGMLVLPQRQTALVAKQAAEVDVLSGGRLRLGVGLGWNPVEYEALGEDFRTRGRRCEEQIALLRALWTSPVVAFEGQWHRVDHAGINPLPVQRPIPIWIGAGRGKRPVPPEASLRRIARLADGWFGIFDPDEQGRAAVARVRAYAEEAGRDPATLGLEGQLRFAPDTGPRDWVDQARAWQALGATHLSVGIATGGPALDGGLRPVGPSSPQEYLEALRRVKEALVLL